MDKEVLERLEKIEAEMVRTKKQILTEIAVHDNKVDGNISTLALNIRVLQNHVNKYFDYENYFNKLSNS